MKIGHTQSERHAWSAGGGTPDPAAPQASSGGSEGLARTSPSELIEGRRPLPVWLRLATLVMLYFLLTLCSRYCGIEPRALTPIQPATGVLVSWLLWLPVSFTWLTLAVAACAGIAANLITGAPLGPSTAFTIANCGTGWLAASALRRWLPPQHANTGRVGDPVPPQHANTGRVGDPVGAAPRFDHLRNMVILIAAGAGLSSALGAVIGAIVVGHAGENPFGETWLIWFLSNAWGILIVVPLVSEWERIRNIFRNKVPQAWTECLVLAVLLGGAAVVFTDNPGVGPYAAVAPYVIFPLLVWIALRFSVAGASVSSLALTVAVLAATAQGRGRFALHYPDLHGRVLELQVFMTMATVCSLIAAAIIADRQRAIAALAKRERQLRRAYDAGKMWSWELDLQTLALTLSEDAAAIGIKFTSGQDRLEHWVERVHPGDRARLDEILNHLKGSDSPLECDLRLRWTDGAYHWIYNRGGATTRQGVRIISGVSMDITERKLAEQAHQQSEERFRRVVEHIPDALVLDDLEGKVVFANDQFCSMFGFSRAELSNVLLEDYVAPESRELLRARHDLRMRGEPVPTHYEYQGLRRDGRRIWLEADVVPTRDEDGRITGKQSIIRDITERKQREQALLFDEKLASVDRLAATIAHQINDPLTAAMNALFLAESDASLSETAKRNLQMVESELRRVAAVPRQTPGFYKQLRRWTEVDLRQVVGRVLELHGPKLRNKSLAVRREFRGAQTITGVEGELRQIVFNLVANSIEALPKNGTLRIRVSGPETWIRNCPMVRLTIADNGTGISPENLRRIFEPFFTTRQSVGTGLGLWVARELVKAHDGSIRLRSQTGRGTVTDVWLPVESRQGSRAA